MRSVASSSGACRRQPGSVLWRAMQPVTSGSGCPTWARASAHSLPMHPGSGLAHKRVRENLELVRHCVCSLELLREQPDARLIGIRVVPAKQKGHAPRKGPSRLRPRRLASSGQPRTGRARGGSGEAGWRAEQSKPLALQVAARSASGSRLGPPVAQSQRLRTMRGACVPCSKSARNGLERWKTCAVDETEPGRQTRDAAHAAEQHNDTIAASSPQRASVRSGSRGSRCSGRRGRCCSRGSPGRRQAPRRSASCATASCGAGSSRPR